jgi:hypothetical protein
MREFLDLFLTYLDKVKVKGNIQDWKEDYVNVQFSTKGNYNQLKNIFVEAEFLDELKENRINFKFILEGQGTFHNKEFFDYGNFLKEEDLLTLTVTLNKRKCFSVNENEILFLDKASFCSKFNFFDSETVKFFENYNDTERVHIFLTESTYIENPYLRIIPISKFSNTNVSILPTEIRQQIDEIKKEREDYTKTPERYPIPHLFNLSLSDSELNITFKRNLFFICLSHIANKYNNGTFLVRGQKNLELIWSQNLNPKNVNILFKTINFIYKIEKFVHDKLEITRNVLSIYHHSSGSIEDIDEQLPIIYETIEQHFSIYVSNQVKDFFDNRKEAIEEAQKYAMNAREAADKIVTNINTAMISIITAIFSAAITMSRGNYTFLFIILILQIIYLVVTYNYNSHFAKKKKEDILNIYKLSSEQIPIVSPVERKKIRETFLIPAVGYIDKNLGKYKILTVSLITITISFLIVLLIFHKQLLPEQPKPQEQKVYIIHAKQELEYQSNSIF